MRWRSAWISWRSRARAFFSRLSWAKRWVSRSPPSDSRGSASPAGSLPGGAGGGASFGGGAGSAGGGGCCGVSAMLFPWRHAGQRGLRLGLGDAPFHGVKVCGVFFDADELAARPDGGDGSCARAGGGVEHGVTGVAVGANQPFEKGDRLLGGVYCSL